MSNRRKIDHRADDPDEAARRIAAFLAGSAGIADTSPPRTHQEWRAYFYSHGLAIHHDQDSDLFWVGDRCWDDQHPAPQYDCARFEPAVIAVSNEEEH